MKCIFTFICVAIGIHCYAQNFNKPKLDSLFDNLADKNMIMGNTAIYQSGKQVYTKSFGYREIELRTKNNDHTLNRLGEISETYIAAIIFQLIDEKKLDLNQKLDDFFPELPHSPQITIENLLRQQSGFPAVSLTSIYTSDLTFAESKPAIINTMKAQKSLSEPGKESLHSDINYLLLSWIAEKIEGKSLTKIFKQRIIEPAYLKTTEFGGKLKSKNNEAIPYIYDKNWQKVPYSDSEIKFSTSIVANSQELAKFYVALFEKDLIDILSLNKMVSMENDYGMGVQKLSFRDKLVYGHEGKLDGFEAFVLYFANEGTSIAFTANGSRIKISELAYAVASIYFGYDYNLSELDRIKK